MALALFNPFLLKVVHRQSPSHGLKTPVDRFTRCHPLTLIVSRFHSSFEEPSLLTGCVYLHAYLVFKEPTAARQGRPTRHRNCSHRPSLAWRASPPVGSGVSRGTLRGYYRHPPVSTHKLPRRKKKTLAAELDETPELGTADKPWQISDRRTFEEYPVPIPVRQVNEARGAAVRPGTAPRNSPSSPARPP